MLQLLIITIVFIASVVLANIDRTITHKTFLDVELAGENIGRIEIGLYGNIVPKTVYPCLPAFLNCRLKTSELYVLVKHNLFTQLMYLGEFGYGYEGSKFFRVVDGFLVQGISIFRVLFTSGGDFTRGDGRGGKSSLSKMNDVANAM